MDRAPPDAVVTWVPLGRRRKRARGFDQAEALARPLAADAGLHLRRLLVRTAETAPQARRGGEARRAALRGAFRALGAVPQRVLLIDDVLTSGATAAECARTLLGAGADEVGVLTAARSLGGPLPARCYKIDSGLQPGSVVARERSSR
jgi:predicted amidophosphoribosyltransferase